MEKTLTRVETLIDTKEMELIEEYETHHGIPLIASPFWTGHILLAREIQANLQLARGIKEVFMSIRKG